MDARHKAGHDGLERFETATAYVARLSCAIYVRSPNRRDADGPQSAGLRRHPGYVRVRCRTLPRRLRHQHVLHVAHDGRQPQGLQSQRGRIPEAVQADAGAGRRHPQARLQSHARARRQYLLHGQARRDRRAFVPASRRGHDRQYAGRLCQDDARRRPFGRRQSLAIGQERAVAIRRRCGGEKGRCREAESQSQGKNQGKSQEPKTKPKAKSKSKSKSAKRK